MHGIRAHDRLSEQFRQGYNNSRNTIRRENHRRPAAGEGTTAAQTEKEVVDLRFVFYGDMTTRREEFFKNEFHDKVLEDLGINMTVETLP